MRSSISCCTDSPKDPGASIDSRPQGYIGVIEKEMETTLILGIYIGIMEKKMEATIILGIASLLAQHMHM